MPYKPPVHRPIRANLPVFADHGQVQSRDRKSVYNSARWISLRQAYLSSHPLCEECQRRGEIVPAQHVHHRIDLSMRPDMAFDASNLEALCLPCHSRETARRMHNH